MKGNIRCPHCKKEEELDMPEDRCIPFAACKSCGKLIEAKGDDGKCCVFCKYGDTPCPMHDKKTDGEEING